MRSSWPAVRLKPVEFLSEYEDQLCGFQLFLHSAYQYNQSQIFGSS